MTKKAPKKIPAILDFNKSPSSPSGSSSAPKKGLGRGLESLLGQDIDFTKSLGGARKAAAAASSESQESLEGVSKISVKQLQRGRFQPRNKMSEAALQELADSIATQGVIQPLIVRALKGEGKAKYEIIAGERRFQASKLAGLSEVPAIVVDISDEQAAIFALIENMQREDLNPLEEALGVQRLIQEFRFTHEQAAQAIGRSRSVTSNLLRLLNLTEPVQKLLLDNQLDMGHARALLALDAATQVMAANQVVAKKLSVRDTERLVKTLSEPKSKKPGRSGSQSAKSADTVRLEKLLSDHLNTRVEIRLNRKNQGALVIDFHSMDQLNDLLARQGLDKLEH